MSADTLRRESPTLYRALSDRLKQDGLSWGALESVALETSEHFRLLTPEDARKALTGVKFTGEYSGEIRDNPDFFAFTKRRVYYQNHGEVGPYIASVPRNPLDVFEFFAKDLQIVSTAEISEGLQGPSGVLPEK